MVWLLMLVVVLSDPGLEKRLRSATLTVALVAAVANGDPGLALSLLQQKTL